MGAELSHQQLGSGVAMGSPADFAKNYTLGKKLGVGATAEVRLCTHNSSGAQCAAKIVPKALFAKQPRLKERLSKETAIMKDADHPNILNLLGCHETDDSVIMLLELAPNGELFDHLVRKGRLPEREAKTIFKQLISAVQYCHDHNVCHRDIKPENILLTADNNVKLADFGFATHMHCASDESENWADTSCGSPHYASPEVIAGQRYQGPQADTWSCGVMLFALLTGGLPFDGESVPQLLRAVKAGKFNIPDWVDPSAAQLIRCMMALKPADRPSLADVANHPWLAEQAPITTIGRFAVSAAPATPPQPEPGLPLPCGSQDWTDSMSVLSIASAGSVSEMISC